MTILTQQPRAGHPRWPTSIGNGIPDLAVLTANGVSVYLGNGKEGSPDPVTYDAGPDPPA